MRILEVGDQSFFQSLHPEQIDYYYLGKKNASLKPFLTWEKFLHLRRQLKAGRYDLVILSVFANSSPIWRRNRRLFSRLLRVAKGLPQLYSFGPEVVLWLLHGLDTPLIVVDRKDDPDKIPPHFFKILQRSKKYFWREHPIKLEHGFTYATGYLEDTSAIRKFPTFIKHHHKIEPISLGVRWHPAYDQAPAVAKTIDLFFAGSSKGSRVRSEGARLLSELKAEGFNIHYEENKIYSFKDYLHLCAQSRLVWSPEGHGWDCYRHYEVALAHSIPVINYPRIRRYQPLLDHQHAFYYGIENDDLKRVVKSALALGPEKLRQMAEAARAHVQQYHLEDKIFHHICAAANLPEVEKR